MRSWFDLLRQDEGNILRKMCRDARRQGKTLAGTPEFRRLQRYRRRMAKLRTPDFRPIYDGISGNRIVFDYRVPGWTFIDEATEVTEDMWLRMRERFVGDGFVMDRRHVRIEPRPLRPDQPCHHPGCLSHVSHPCEGCGRIAGRSPDEKNTIIFRAYEEYIMPSFWDMGTRPSNVKES